MKNFNWVIKKSANFVLLHLYFTHMTRLPF